MPNPGIRQVETPSGAEGGPVSSLTEIAAELYVRPRAEFVPVRDTRAKETADPELGAQIRALRKPSIAAWVVNVFAAERAEQLGQALGLAEELRERSEERRVGN